MGVAVWLVAAPMLVCAQGAAVVGVATVKGSAAPVGYVDVTHLESGRATFGAADGKFALRGLPAGPATIRVRRVGFAPFLTRVDVVPGRTDTLRVELSPIAVQLAQVRVGTSSCGSRSSADTALAAILEQVRASAERSDLFAKEYPYDLSMERMIVNTGDFIGKLSRTRPDTITRDTVSISGWRDWTYAPGTLIRPASVGGAPDKLRIPQLSDFATLAFVESHCFRFDGVVTFEGKRRIRIDFEPARGVPAPDVRGSLYLDEKTLELERSTLVVDRPSPQAPNWDTWSVTVNTWFDAIAPGHYAIRRITSRTTAQTTRPRAPQPTGASTESQERIALRFTDRAPD